MKNEELYEVLSDIDEDYVNQARQAAQKKPKSAWRRWIPLAACLGLIVMVLGILWASSFERKPYTIVYEGGRCYLVCGDEMRDEFGPQKPSGSVDSMEIDPVIHFDSLEDMQESMLNGQLDKHQLYMLYNFFDRDRNGRIIIPDLRRVDFPIMPVSAEIDNVRLYSKGYMVELSWSIDGVDYEGTWTGEEYFGSMFDNLYQSQVDEREAAECTVEYDEKGGEIRTYLTPLERHDKLVVYKVTNETGTFIIVETYVNGTLYIQSLLAQTVNGNYALRIWNEVPCDWDFLLSIGIEYLES